MANAILDFFLRRRIPEDRARALAYEHERAKAMNTGQPLIDDLNQTFTALAGEDPVPFFTVDGRVISVDRAILRGHGLFLGEPGAGKSRCAAMQIMTLLRRAIQQLKAMPERDDEQLPIELVVIDVKSETYRLLAEAVAALYRTASPRAKRAIRRSFHSIRTTRTEITPEPLLVPRDDVSPDYQATMLADVIVRSSAQEWPESVKFVFTQILRILLARGKDLDLAEIRRLLRSRAHRAEAAAHVDSVALRDFLLNFDSAIRPQTADALERRLQIEWAFEQVLCAISFPHAEAIRRGVPLHAPITFADYGSADLPPSLGIARANVQIVDRILAAGRREPSTDLILFIEEALELLKRVPSLCDHVLSALRLLRYRRVSLLFAQQWLEALPRTVVKEFLQNIRWATVFRSQPDIGDFLFPHVPLRPDDVRLSDAKRRQLFDRTLASLPRQDAFFLAKGFPTLRVRALDFVDPSAASGVPSDELFALFHEEITPRSRVSLAEARRLIGTATVSAAPEHEKSPRSIFGFDDEEEIDG